MDGEDIEDLAELDRIFGFSSDDDIEVQARAEDTPERKHPISGSELSDSAQPRVEDTPVRKHPRVDDKDNENQADGSSLWFL